MAKAEKIVLKVGELPYGSLLPNEVARASGAARIIAKYTRAVEAGLAMPPPKTTQHVLEETHAIARNRLERAILGTARVPAPPTERSLHEMSHPTDPDATAAPPSLIDARARYEQRMADLATYAEKATYGLQHEEVFQAAIRYTVDMAREDWEIAEANDIAASRGYVGVAAMTDAVSYETLATIGEYARTS